MDKSIVEIRPENVLFRFYMENQQYAILGESIDDESDDDVITYFAKLNIIDGQIVARNIETEEEYDRVVKFFDDRMNRIGGEF